MQPDGRRFYGNLEAMRGLCAMAVVLTHTPWATSARSFAGVSNAWLMVDFFFVLSGFVIAANFGTRDRPMQVWRFLRARFYRLYPLHIITLVVVIVMVIARERLGGGWSGGILNGDQLPGVVQNIFLVHGLGFMDTAILNAPSWSISTEMAAYVLFAGLCIAVPNMEFRTVCLVIVAMLCMVALYVYYPNAGLEKPSNFRLPRCLYSFAIGALTARAVSTLPSPPSEIVAFLQILLIALLLYWMSVAGRESLSYLFAPYLIAAIIWTAANDQSSWVRRLLETRPLRVGGALSYSFYMIHVPVGMALFFIFSRMGLVEHGTTIDKIGRWNDWLTATYVIAVVLISFLTYHWIEKPWREYGRRMPGEPTANKAATA